MKPRVETSDEIRAGILERLKHVAVLVHPQREDGVHAVLWKYRVIPEGIAVGVMWVRVYLPILPRIDDAVIIGSTECPVESVDLGHPSLFGLGESERGNRDADLGWSFLPRQWLKTDEGSAALIRRCIDIAPPTFDADSFRRRVKDLMKQQGLSNDDIAGRLKEHRSYVNHFLTRRSEPRFHAAERFAIALGVDVEYLIGDCAERATKPR